MKRHAIRLSMVLALAAPVLPAAAGEVEFDADQSRAMADYWRKQTEFFDELSNDASPRRQILAAQVYIPDDDAAPSVLRPKRGDVVARAARFAAGDAFVQWFAASEGSYTSSACGPTTWPAMEVANFVDLEPDNAAAWQYAAALAQAKGDQAGVDDALARLGASGRAEDHSGDLIAEWTSFYLAHPQFAGPDFSTEATASPQATALKSALQHAAGHSDSASYSLKEACTPNPDSEGLWRRIGGCIDAGRLLASRGNSLDLRELGMQILEVAGDRSDESVALRRQLDWLTANSANPWRNYAALQDAPADLLADWNGTHDEFLATARRLHRLGLPLQAPAGWTKPADREETEETVARDGYASYLTSIAQAMRSSSDVRLWAVAERLPVMIALYQHSDSATASSAPAGSGHRLGDLADEHADDALVQWLTATASVGKTVDAATHAKALSRVQLEEADNAAAWLLNLADADGPSDSFARMAASKAFNAHMIDVMRLVADVARSVPPSDDLLQYARSQMHDDAFSADAYADFVAVSIAASTLNAPYKALLDGCKQAERAASCASIGHLMVHKSGTLLDAYMGQQILRQAGALDADEADFMRHVEWWAQGAQAADAGLFRDIVSTGDEIEASRRVAERNGKTEPPADWVAPTAKRADAAARR